MMTTLKMIMMLTTTTTTTMMVTLSRKRTPYADDNLVHEPVDVRPLEL